MKRLSRFLASEVIEIEGGRARSTKGRHTQRLLGEIADVCSAAQVERGEIWFGGDGRLSFSKHIPSAARQALRNVIVNQR